MRFSRTKFETMRKTDRSSTSSAACEFLFQNFSLTISRSSMPISEPRPRTERMRSGAVMRGYALVPKSKLSRPGELAKMFAECVAYAKTLLAKETNPKKSR